jgi:hypothetical protein
MGKSAGAGLYNDMLGVCGDIRPFNGEQQQNMQGRCSSSTTTTISSFCIALVAPHFAHVIACPVSAICHLRTVDHPILGLCATTTQPVAGFAAVDPISGFTHRRNRHLGSRCCDLCSDRAICTLSGTRQDLVYIILINRPKKRQVVHCPNFQPSFVGTLRSFFLSAGVFTMHSKLLLLLAAVPSLLASPSPVKRSGFSSGQPIDDNGRGAPILGENTIPQS